MMELDPDYGLELIEQAYKEDTDDRLFDNWKIEHVAEMVLRGGAYTSFNQYKQGCLKAAAAPAVPRLTAQEIIARAEKIKAADQRGR